MAAYNAAVAERKTPSADTLAGLAKRYRASPEYQRQAESTRKNWSRWLDRICDTEGETAIGDIPTVALDDRRVREELLAWRDQWAATPRSADYAIQVLSRVLSWAMGRGLVAINAAAGVEQLYANDRADQIWTAADISAYCAKAPSPEVGYIVRLACLTGLRRGDLASLLESQVGDLAIIKPTGKSRRRKGARTSDADDGARKTAVIPILEETRALIAEILAQKEARHAELLAQARRKERPEPAKALTLLTNTRGRPWTPDGLEHQVIETKAKAGVDRHLHDARGTFATRLRRAGLSAPEIADILGWEEDRVKRLLATYVDRESIVRSIAERIRRNESGPQTGN